MNNSKVLSETSVSSFSLDDFLLQMKKKSDNMANYFIAAYFSFGLILAVYYDTWLIAIGVGGFSVVAYYSAKILLPESNMYQYVFSTILGIFMAQFIYQMHGMFEMHFVAFIGSAVLITYQNWKMQIPIVLVVVIHHAIFGYMQFIGYDKFYFTQLNYMDLQTFIFHVILAAIIFYICGLWAYHFRQNSQKQIDLSNEIVARDTTILKKTQALLEESEEQYRNVVGILQEGIVIQDADGKTIAANASAERILGLTHDQMIGLTSRDQIWQMIHEDGTPYQIDEYPVIISLTTGQPISGYIMGLNRSDGELIWMSVNTQPLYKNGDSKLDGVVVSFSEITKRKKAEQELLSSNANINAWMNNTQDAIWSVDQNYNILACNSRFIGLFKLFYDIEIKKGDNFIENIPLETREDFKGLYNNSLSGQSFTLEYPAVLNTDEIKIFELTFNPIYEGEEITGVAAFAKDITQRKHQQDEIRRSKANLDAWINSTKDAIWSTDTNYTILACNNHFKELFKLYTNRTIQEGDSFLDSLTLGVEENVTALTGLYNRALSGETFSIEYPAVSPEGEITFFEITFNPIYDDENVTGVASSAKDITEYKKQQEEIRRSRANLDAWMNNTKDSIWAVDRELNIILMNKSCAQGYQDLTGYTLELGKSSFNLIHPDLAEYWTNLYNRAFAGESFIDEQSYVINNVQNYMDMSLSPIYEGEDVIGVAVLSIDVTQRKKTEQVLKETMLLQRTILDSSNYMIIATSLEGIITTFNPAAEESLGYTADELVGKLSPAIFHDLNEVVERSAMLSIELGFEIPPGFETFVAKAKLGQLYEDEWIYVRKDGSRFPVMLSLSAMRNVSGEIMGYLGIATDITAKKQTLQELERRDILLEGTSHALQHLITAHNFEEGLQDTVAIIGQAANADRVYFCRSYLSENKVPTMRLIAEWNNESLEFDKPQYTEVRYTDIDLERWYKLLSDGSIIYGTRSSFPESERAILIEVGMHSLLVAPVILKENLWGFIGLYDFHEERIWEEWERVALQSIAASLAGAIGRHDAQENLEYQAQDLELKNVELTHARESAEVANHAKSTFLSSMSHELRTPLNAILGFAQILQKDKTLPEQSRNYISMMYRSGNHLLDMINDVLDISKIEAGHMELLYEEFDLHELFADIEEMFTLRCKEKKLDFHIDSISQDLRFVVGDQKRFKQVLINLISNAVKFTTVGSINISIVETRRSIARVGTEAEETAWIKFSITDTGRGIPPEQVHTIFQPFKQVSGIYSDGTGLGLAICDKIIRMMGGEIAIQSALGVGSTFRFELPMKVHQAALVTKMPGSKPVTGIKGERNWRILVVDDIATNCIVARGLLEPLGFTCDEADTGRAALDKVKEFKPDLILMDILMPDMCGDEATKILREMPEYAELPIIALTASGFDGKRDELMGMGFSEYLRKPFLEDELLMMIGEFIHVEYIRDEDEEEGGEDGATSSTKVELSVTDIAKLIQELPDQIRVELSEAIEFQDFDLIQRLLGQLPRTSQYIQVENDLRKAVVLSNYKLLMAITDSLESSS